MNSNKGQEPEHADFDPKTGHMHSCLYDEYDDNSHSCNEDCAAWLYALWTRCLEENS